MRCVNYIVLSFVLCLFIAGIASAENVKLKAGQEGDLIVKGAEDWPNKIFIPKNYKEGTKTPLILFMHGWKSKPTTWPLRHALESKDYIVVGLSYGICPGGGQGQEGIKWNPQLIKGMQEYIDTVRKMVDDMYGVDQDHVILAGFSMGGFSVNYLGWKPEHKSVYEGYFLLGASVVNHSGVDLKVTKGKPVIMINGETCQNVKHAIKDKDDLIRAGAIVKQIVIPGQGHNPNVASIQQHVKDWFYKDLKTAYIPGEISKAKDLLRAKRYGEARKLVAAVKKAAAENNLCEKEIKEISAIVEKVAASKFKPLRSKAVTSRVAHLLKKRLVRIETFIKEWEGTKAAEEAKKFLAASNKRLESLGGASAGKGKSGTSADGGKSAADEKKAKLYWDMALEMIEAGNGDTAKHYLKMIVDTYPKTSYAVKANDQLKKL